MINVRAELTGDGGGLSRLQIEGHQGHAAGGDGRVCTAVTTAFDVCLAYLHALAQEFPDALSVTITERETPPCPT